MSSSTTADGATASVPQNVDFSHDQLQIPKAAIKRIMKLDPEVSQVANDAVVLVAKATEMFLEKFAGAAEGVLAFAAEAPRCCPLTCCANLFMFASSSTRSPNPG